MRRKQLTLNANSKGCPNGSGSIVGECHSVGTPQRGSSTKPRASDRRERRPGWYGILDGALKGQKRHDGQRGLGLLPFQGVTSAGMDTQGVAHMRSLALGLELDGLSGRNDWGNVRIYLCGNFLSGRNVGYPDIGNFLGGGNVGYLDIGNFLGGENVGYLDIGNFLGGGNVAYLDIRNFYGGGNVGYQDSGNFLR